jgi:hypothetical protein
MFEHGYTALKPEQPCYGFTIVCRIRSPFVSLLRLLHIQPLPTMLNNKTMMGWRRVLHGR